MKNKSIGKALFDSLCSEIQRFEAENPDMAIVMIENPSAVAVSSVRGMPRSTKSLLVRICLHPDGAIWFNLQPSLRNRSTGVWDAKTMSLGLVGPRNELLGTVPERVETSELQENGMSIDIPALAPCPKCREQERLSTDRHPGTAFARCEACNYRGPEFMPRQNTSEQELLAAVVHAWNNVPR